MFKKRLSVIAATFFMGLSIAQANASTCYTFDESQNTVAKECNAITLIDFNGNAALEDQSMVFSDWNQKLQGTYENSVGDGSTTTVGNNGAYNHHGVQGSTPNQFAIGERITVHYINTGTEAETFYPMLSFDDPDGQTITGTENDGFWLRSDEPLTLSPGASDYYTLSIHEAFSASLINTNVHHNGAGQQNVSVDRIDYHRIDEQDRPIPPCFITGEWGVSKTASSASCNQVTLLDVKATKQTSKASMGLATLSEILGSKYQILSASGNGTTTLKQVLYNQSVMDTPFINSTGGYTGVKSPNGETHRFLPGEMIEINIKVGSIDAPMVSTPKISFDDSDSIPWGDTGTWYDLEQKTLEEHSQYTFYYTFTKASAGDYALVNFSLDKDHKGEISIKKLTYHQK